MVGQPLANELLPKRVRWDVTSISLFYRFYLGKSSSTLRRFQSPRFDAKASMKSQSFASTLTRKRTTMQAGKILFCWTLTISRISGADNFTEKVFQRVRRWMPFSKCPRLQMLQACVVALYNSTAKLFPTCLQWQPLIRLTRKGTSWTSWTKEEQASFQRLKNVLSKK